MLAINKSRAASFHDGGEKARAVWQSAHREVLGDSLPQIGERGAGTKIDTSPHGCGNRQQRDMLPGMVGAGGGGIVAVISRYDQQVVRQQLWQQRGEPRIEPLEIGGVPGDVVPVPV